MYYLLVLGVLAVAPFVGAWIEIILQWIQRITLWVAPFVGAWIEIKEKGELVKEIESLRSSERGLKSTSVGDNMKYRFVAPFVGAWIEIQEALGSAWRSTSLRSSERGLKSEFH